MTPEQRIAQLESDLARERAEKDDLRALVKSFQARMDLETSQRASRKTRNDRHRDGLKARDVSLRVSGDAIETSHSPSSPSSPPFSSSPSSTPSSSPPLSSSPSSSPPVLAPANRRIHERLSEVHMRHQGSVLPFDARRGNAEHLALLNLASQQGLSGGPAEDEVCRRFDHMLQRQALQFEPGRHKGTTLAELLRPECWGANAKPPAREAPAPERHLGIAPPPGAPTAEDRRRAHQEYLAREAAKKAASASGGAS